MIEGSLITLSDNIHTATVVKVLSNQSFVIECSDKQLSFVKLVDNDDLSKGIPWSTWGNYFYKR